MRPEVEGGDTNILAYRSHVPLHEPMSAAGLGLPILDFHLPILTIASILPLEPFNPLNSLKILDCAEMSRSTLAIKGKGESDDYNIWGLFNQWLENKYR